MNPVKACIFDLDGVIVDTAVYHYQAWRRLANDLGFDFSEQENEKLKGVGRMDSLNLILQWGGKDLSEEEKMALAAKKNDWYVESIQQMNGEEILEGVLPFLEELQQRGIRISLGSASKNAPVILKRVGLYDRFDAIIDGNHTTIGKPHPQVFLKGAEALGVEPSHCIVFEDAAKGIDAALRGGMYAVGIGNPAVLHRAHLVIPSFVGRSFDHILEALSTAKVA
ncbi:MAG: beta-phosphoglucomutase [Bacteroidota bacterium]